LIKFFKVLWIGTMLSSSSSLFAVVLLPMFYIQKVLYGIEDDF
jgi:hypothetical protein